jgi:hypothetical protein
MNNANKVRSEPRVPAQRRFYPLPDAILFLYLLCIARQYLWPLSGSEPMNAAAWTISVLIAAAVLCLYSSRRGEGWEGTESAVAEGWHSWLPSEAEVTGQLFGRVSFDWLWVTTVVAPLLIFFFLRAPFPAFEMDHLNYHIVNTERALRGWPMILGDFFPGTLLVNPAPDMAFGVLKYLIGYRLAPLLNIGALLWTAHVLNEILAPILSRKPMRYFGVLFILATDQISYLVNIYMIDLLSLPLLTTAALLCVRIKNSKDKGTCLVKIGLLLGISIAFKLTNLFFAAPIALLCLFELIKLYTQERFLPAKTTIAWIILMAVLPSLPFLAYMYSQTGNPVFPYYNAIFKSSLMTVANYHDTHIGPDGFLTKLFWPIISFVYPTDLSAMNTAIIYSGRLNFGFVLALCTLFFTRTPSSIRRISFITVFGSYIWSFTSGDLRYALIGEVFGGIICCFIFKYLYDQAFGRFATVSAPLKSARTAFALVLAFSLLQTTFAVWFGLVHFECANEKLLCDRVMQPVYTNKFTATTFMRLLDLEMPKQLDFNQTYSYVQEASYFLRDRRAQDFFSNSDKAQFGKVDLWINSSDATSGYMAMAAGGIPMISVAKFLHLFDYMQAEGARLRVRELLRTNRQRKMFTLVQEQRYGEAVENLSRVGLKPGEIKEVSVPLYSPNIRAHLLLVELLFDG